MTRNIRHLIYSFVETCLMFTLICQTTRQIAGYPHRRSWIDLFNPSVTVNIQRMSVSSEHESQEISQLIDRAYQTHELLPPGQWIANNGVRSTRPVQRDTSKYQDTHTAFISLKQLKQRTSESMQGQRKLLENRRELSTDTTMQSDGKIIFPTDDSIMMHHHSYEFNPQPAPICHGSTFCENASYYPRDLVNVAIQRNESLKFLAGVDVVTDIVQRIDAADETPLCVSTEQVVYPQSAENKRKEWLFVVNQDNFKQGIRIEICSNEDDECNVIEVSEGYRTSCKQKFIYRQLAAIANDGSIISDSFRFPSSCCCHIKFVPEPLTRLGVVSKRNNRTMTSKRRRK